jgi:hypothetical protein
VGPALHRGSAERSAPVAARSHTSLLGVDRRGVSERYTTRESGKEGRVNGRHEAVTDSSTSPERQAERAASEGRFRRSLGLLPATAVNMTQMCGIGPFITIPIMVATLGGLQAVVG